MTRLGRTDARHQDRGLSNRALGWCVLLLLVAPLHALAQSYPASLSNTATLTMPVDATDPDTGNNSSTDQNALSLLADIGVTKSVLSASPVPAGGAVRYQILVSNAGPSRAQGIVLNDSMPAQLQNVIWACTPTAGSSCGAGSGSGNLSLLLDLAAGGTATVLVNATAPVTTPSTIAGNTASIVMPGTISDPVPGNNTSTTPSITVMPESIVAGDDAIGPVDGRIGNASAGNVLTNDTLAGAAATSANATLTVQVAPATTNIVLDTATGNVSVAAATPAGSYPLTYRLCQASDPNNCTSAVATVQVSAAALVANADTAGPIAATTGGTGVVNVLANDTLNGTANPGAAVTLTSTLVPGSPITINPDGSVDVAASATPGNYSVAYQICEVLNPTNCADSTVSVVVAAGQAVIDAVDDLGSLPAWAGGAAVGNVLANDAFAGSPPTPAQVTLTQVSATPGLSLDTATGTVTLAPASAPGSYTLRYQLCEAGQSTGCDEANVTVTATAADLVANDDTAGPVLGTTGGDTGVNVLDNDSFNGASIPAGAVTLTPVTGPITVAANGNVAVTAGTAPGNHTVSYTICETGSSNCASASVVVSVSAAPPTLDAVDDATGVAAGAISAGNVLANDSIGGDTPNVTTVVLTQLSGTPQVSIDASGAVTLAAGLAPGSYTARYRICQAGDANNCDEANVNITVAAPPVAVDAVDDAASVIAGATGAGNVLLNDTVGGSVATQVNGTLAQLSGAADITLGADGAITLRTGLGAGTYTASYRLCATASPASCDTATVSVTVNAAAPDIDAVDDAFSLPAGTTAAVSVLVNDSVGGAAATAANVTVSQTGGQPGIVIAADGTLSVVAGTVPGSYVASYGICEVANPDDCDTASVSVTVTAPAAVIVAVDDSLASTPGSNAGSVLVNDSVDGAPATIVLVHVDQLAGTPALVIVADGGVHVAAGAAPGTYAASYRICAVDAPDNCATANVDVTVTATAAVVDAVADHFTIAAGGSGGSVLANDTIGGSAADTVNATVSQQTGAPVIVISGSGVVSIQAGSAPGTYQASYVLCTVATPVNCDTASVSVTVPAPVVVVSAINDVFSAPSGSADAGNVLNNDSVGGAPALVGTGGNATVAKTGGSAAISLSAGGVIGVASGTAAGSYVAIYQLCDIADAGNCESASVTVNVTATLAVEASDDSFTVAAGTSPLGNVLSNDRMDGAPASAANVTLVQTTGGATLSIAADGDVTLLAGNGAGSYSATYRICQEGAPDNCDTAWVTVTVTASAVLVDGANDGFALTVGDTGAGNVLDNDSVGGAPATTTNASIAQINGGPELTIAPDGAVTVAANTPAGSYSASYRLCQATDPANCDTATVLISVSAAIAADDDAFVAVSGDANAGNALANDLVRGAAANPGNAALTQISGQSAITIASDGTVGVIAGTLANTYTAGYRICEPGLPSSCDEATVTVAVSAASTVAAVGDIFSTVAGNAGVGNVLGNDAVNGALATPGDVLLTQNAGQPAISIASTGVVSVPAGTLPGTYTGSYTICLASAPARCSSASVSMTVTAAPVVVLAVDDAFTSAAGNANAGNVLFNDSVDGEPATTATVAVTQQGGTPAITIGGNGAVAIAANTPAGTYTASYQICQTPALTPCDAATVTVTVPVSASVSAVDDAFSTAAGTISAGNVLINDAFNGGPVTTADVTLSQLSGLPALVIAPDGAVSIAAGTGAGVYLASYRICERVSGGSNCATANVTMTVNATVLPIEAVNDALTLGAGGSSTVTVLVNDTVGGSAATTAQVTLSQLSGGPAISIAADGTVSVAAGTAASTYPARYEICRIAAPADCDTADVSVTVSAAQAIVAVDDVFSATTGGASAGNVLLNDTLDSAQATAAMVTLTQLGGTPTLTIASDGTVVIAAGATVGPHSASYRICEIADVDNCDTATVSVTVTAAAITVMAANDVLSGQLGGPSPGNVLDNDTINGNPASQAAVELTQTGGQTVVAIAAEGTVSLVPGTLPGVYTASYQICATGSAVDCASATVSVTVVAATAVVDAIDDNFSATPGATGVGNVLVNDSIDGNVATTSTVVLRQSDGQPQVVIANDGSVSVAAGVVPGTHTADYQICQVGVPANCATATVSVTVTATAQAIDAVDDSLSGTAGGAAVGNVLSNDQLAGVAADSATVALTQLTGTPPITIAPDGSVAITAGTVSGSYTATYRICDQANAGNCATATVTVAVTATANVISAIDDTMGGVAGGAASGNVLSNDSLGGGSATTAEVLVSQVSGGPVLTVLVDGSVSIATGTAAGSYSAVYRICERAAPANCDTATVTVAVTAAGLAISAADDAFGPVNGGTGSTNLGNVLINDRLGTAVPIASTVILIQTAGQPPVTLTVNGGVSLAAGTAAGSYTASYRICERANPINCDVAQVTVTVQAAAIVANDDAAGPIDGVAGARDVLNVLANDAFNGHAPVAGEVIVAPVTQGPLSIDQNGLLDVAPKTPAGSYLITYRICDAQNPASCDDATVTVTVRAAPLQAADDAAQVPQNNGQVIAVLGNDSQGDTTLDATRATITQVTTPEHGAAVSDGKGGIVYTPGSNYSGTDTFQYTVCETATPSNCATATVTITVLPNEVTATDDTAQTTAPDPVVVDVLVNDTVTGAPLDPASLAIVGAPANGSANCSQGKCTYTPNAGFDGIDSFTYRVCDSSTPTPVCGTAVATVTVNALDFSVRLSLAVAQRTVRIGGVARYTAVVENVGNVDLLDDTVTITPPPGFTYVQGTLQLDSNPVAAAAAAATRPAAGLPVMRAMSATPAVRAGTLPSPDANLTATSPITLRGMNLAVGQSVTLVYYLRVGAGVGKGMHISEGIVQETNGQEISNWASAWVEIEGDPLMDESLVLGTVFDDRDGNGIQSPGERGIAGVRIGSVEGLISTTDGYGRFHVIGIDTGNAARGRNFVLKVDAATLPAGTAFTTPNPRVRRITAGIPVRFDFGVHLPQPALSSRVAAPSRQIVLAPALFTADGILADVHAGIVEDIARDLRQGGGQLVIDMDAAGAGMAVQRALSARTALQGKAEAPVDVIVRDGARRPLLQLGGGVVQLAPAVFDGASVNADSVSLLQALADGVAAGRAVAIKVPVDQPELVQLRVDRVREVLVQRLPSGSAPVVLAAGAALPADPISASGEGVR